MTTTLLHLSDSHLDGSAERADRLLAVLNLLPASRRPDAIVLTGDLADTGSDEEYAQVRATLEKKAVAPWIAVPGNHDDPARLAAALGARTDVSVLDAGGLRILGLDVTVAGEDHGELRETVAEQAVALADGARRTVLAFHQPPVPIGHAYADPMRLRDAEALAKLVERIGTVAAVLCGHVHTPVTTTFAGVPLLVAPGIASALRLDPDQQPLTSRSHAPGLALHRFENDGAVLTSFHYAD